MKNIPTISKEAIIKSFWLVLAAASAIILYLTNPELEQNSRLVLATFGVAGILWMTEAVPLYLTSFIIAGIFLLFGSFTPNEVFHPFFDSIIVLFLGGFVLARAFAKYNVDEFVANKTLHYFGNKPGKLMLGLMILSAFLSMWMSNTASTALLLPIAISILTSSKIAKNDPLFKAFPLAIAYAATTGGLGTIIGSSPNALAVKYLGQANLGVNYTFTSWMVQMLPVVIVMLITIYLILRLLYPTKTKELRKEKQNLKINGQGKITLAVTALTVILWLSGEFTGLGSSTVALLPIIFLFGSGLLDQKDLRKLNWDTLLLFGGGLTLGEAVINSGVNDYLAGGLSGLFSGMPIFILFIAILLIGILFTVVASNTGAAVVILPIIISLSGSLGIDPMILVGLTTIGVSLDFILPVGTPPSAIAYSSGYVKAYEMIKTGLVLTIFVITLPAVIAWFVW